MTRLLLILALVCTGLMPGTSCLYAASAQVRIGVEASCEMSCCGLSCCCVVQNDSAPAPDAPVPATPPRGVDLAPCFGFTAHCFALAWDDEPSRPSLQARYPDRIAPRQPKSVQRMTCRWIT